MKSGIHVGTIVEERSISALSNYVKDVFDSGCKNHISDDAIITALKLIETNNITVRDCSVIGLGQKGNTNFSLSSEDVGNCCEDVSDEEK